MISRTNEPDSTISPEPDTFAIREGLEEFGRRDLLTFELPFVPVSVTRCWKRMVDPTTVLEPYNPMSES